MPTRYTAVVPAAYVDGYWAQHGDKTIIALSDERKPADTGLLNAAGLKLYRVVDPEPIGFFSPAKPR